MPRKPIFLTAMNDAERQARRRAAGAAGKFVTRAWTASDNGRIEDHPRHSS